MSPSSAQAQDELQERQKDIGTCSRLGNDQLTDQRPESLAGEVYKLTREDAKVALETAGEVWLTIPFEAHSSPFVTASVSHKRSRQFARQCPRLM